MSLTKKYYIVAIIAAILHSFLIMTSVMNLLLSVSIGFVIMLCFISAGYFLGKRELVSKKDSDL